MRRMWAVGAVLALVVAGCGGEGDEEGSGGDDPSVEQAEPADQPTDGSWTILQYSMADTDLEAFMIDDMAELTAVETGGGLEALALVDRSPGYSDSGLASAGDWVGAKVLQVADGDVREVADLGDVDTADPQVLADFIAEGLTAHPADHYALVISDHGAAWPGIGPDDSSGEVLDLVDLQDALGDGLAAAGVDSLDVLGFDACLMATAEVAIAMAPYADRMIASEELEPGHGWDYAAFQVAADGATPDELGAAVVDSYVAHAEESGTAQEITLSFLDLTRADALESSLEVWADAMVDRGALDAPTVGRQLAGTVAFGKAPDPAESSHMVDLGQLAALVGVESIDLSPFTDDVERAINDMVIRSIDAPATRGASGLSIYFPPSAEHYQPEYADVPGAAGWASFLDHYYDVGSSIPEGEQASLPDGDAEVFFDEDGVNIQSLFDPALYETLAEAFIRYAVVESDGTLTYLGTEPGLLDPEGIAQGTYDLTSLVISDGIDEAVAYVDLSWDDEAGVGSVDVPIAYYPPGSEQDYVDAMLSIVFDAETGDVLQETYYAYDPGIGSYGELTTEPDGIIVPEVLTIGPDGTETWTATSDVGLFADLPALSYELRPLEAGTTLQIELSVVDFGGNSDTTTAQVEVP